jgi:hypothetical protein
MQCSAAVFVLVASFQIWNRVCKMARYSPAREIRVFAVENVPRLGRRPKESVGRVRADAEAPHLLFTQSCGLVGVFRSIIQAFVLPMLHAREDLAFRRSITPQFIGDNHTWDVLELFEELPKKAFRRLLVSSALDKDIQHIAILVHGPPEIVRFPVDLQVHFIQVPCVATTRTATTQFIGIRLPELQTPLSHGFITHDHSSLCVARSSTSRKLSEKRKYNQTAWLTISGGKRKPL